MKNKAIEIIQKAIEQSAEELLDDDGVDSKVAKRLAKEIENDLKSHHLLAVPGPKREGKYLVVVVEDVEPEIKGPYKTENEREQAAKNHRREDEDKSDGIYPLDISEKAKPAIGAYSGGFLDGDEEDNPETAGGNREDL